MSKQPKLTIKNLKCFFGDKEVIHGISLDIPRNEVLSVLGPANSGITTLLRTLNRLAELTPNARAEGDILLDGQNIFDKDINVTDIRRRVGMVFDVPSPLPTSIFENVVFGPSLSGKKSKKKLVEIAEKALSTAALWDEVKDRLSTPAMSLSGGQQQRLCIARVLAMDPEVILLDRPCSGLDPISTSKIEDALIQLKEQYTIVIAPHNVQQAGRVSDRIAFMLGGHIIEEGTNQEVFSNPQHQKTSDYITGRFG